MLRRRIKFIPLWAVLLCGSDRVGRSGVIGLQTPLPCRSPTLNEARSRQGRPNSAQSPLARFDRGPLSLRTRRGTVMTPPGGGLRMHHPSAVAQATTALPVPATSFLLTRIVFLRGLAFVYMVAFLVARQQNRGLIGDGGIAPARDVLNTAEERGKVTRRRRDAWLEQSRLYKGPPLDDPDTSESLRGVANDLSDPPQGGTRAWMRIRSYYFCQFFRLLKYLETRPSRWINPYIHRLGMAVNRNKIYQHWRERLWDRHDGRFRPVTSVLWLAKNRDALNPWLDGVATTGLLLSAVVFWKGAANVPILLVLWICQRSLMAVGGPFYAYGWELQLAELNFHALFLVPLLSLNPMGVTGSRTATFFCPPSSIVLYSIRWYLFRIMLGAGLIKIKSRDNKWNWPRLSAMEYFYETQPVPNPLSRYFHWMPRWWHKGEVVINHLVELIAPWLLLVPNACFGVQRVGGLIQIIFQAVLVASGNLSFLNWLTAVPAIVCLDDAFLGPLLFSQEWRIRAMDVSTLTHISVVDGGITVRSQVGILFGLLIAFLSVPVVRNLASKRQLMNASFGPLRLVNTYGAFGQVDVERHEFIISASSSLEGPWREYDFRVKPGDIRRRPRFLSPYHYRLDWELWIASSLGSIDRSPWLFTLLLKIVQQDREVMRLLDREPFESDQEGPRYIRIDKYRYRFSSQGKEKYWDRQFVGRVYPREGVASAGVLTAAVEKLLLDPR